MFSNKSGTSPTTNSSSIAGTRFRPISRSANGERLCRALGRRKVLAAFEKQLADFTADKQNGDRQGNTEQDLHEHVGFPRSYFLTLAL